MRNLDYPRDSRLSKSIQTSSVAKRAPSKAVILLKRRVLTPRSEVQRFSTITLDFVLRMRVLIAPIISAIFYCKAEIGGPSTEMISMAKQQGSSTPPSLILSLPLFPSNLVAKVVQHKTRRKKGRSQRLLARDGWEGWKNTRCAGHQRGCLRINWTVYRGCCRSLKPNLQRSVDANGADRLVSISLGSRWSYCPRVIALLYVQALRYQNLPSLHQQLLNTPETLPCPL